MDARSGTVLITALGLPPDPDPAVLRAALNQAGLLSAPLELHLGGGSTLLCPPGNACSASHGGHS